MSGLIASFLNFTVGILCDKIRDVTARRLSEGDLTDEKLRKLIVRELDDIKCKLDGLARKDLLCSLSFFKEGICRLSLCLQDTYKRNGKESNVEHGETSTQLAEATTFSSRHDFLFEDALTVSKAVGKLTVGSEERLVSAKKSFRTSREEATRAFNNVALSTDDRIMASKLRIASRILEGLQDRNAAAHDCLLYIEELHSMPAVREIFSVHAKGGIKSRLNHVKRLEKSRSITSLNLALLEFISTFTNTIVGVFNWPAIDLHENVFHPIFDEEDILGRVESCGLKATWETTFSERLTIEGYHSCAVNRKGEIFIIDGKWNRLANIKVARTSGEIELFCKHAFEEKRVMYSVSSLAIDANDHVYLGICCLDTSSSGIRVLVFDPTGSMQRDVNLALEDYFVSDFVIQVTQERIIICSPGGRLHFFDADEFELKTQHTLPDYDSLFESSYLCISAENDIIVNHPRAKTVNIYSDGVELKRKIRLPTKGNTNELVHTVRGVVIDPATKHVLVLMYDPFLFDQASYRLLVYNSTSTELLKTYRLVNFPVEGVAQLTSHPTGSIAVVGSCKAILLQVQV